MADGDEWICNYRDAFSITLVQPRPDGLKSVATFAPKFTQAIFGDDEAVYGYKGLGIQLRYRSNDMRPHLNITYSQKKDTTAEVEVPDIKEILDDGVHLPKIAFVAASDFEESSKAVGPHWSPPGTLCKSIEAGGTAYEVWKGLLSDEKVKQLVRRVQILVPLLIESGTYIVKEDETSSDMDQDYSRWAVFFLFRKETQGAYTFVGHSTVYHFFYFQPPDPKTPPRPPLELPEEGNRISLESLPTRSRLAQFVILPPFKGQGNGSRLYNAIFEYYKDHLSTLEFAVEDPNEAFDDMRDLCDLAFLRTVPEFMSFKINKELELSSKTEILPTNLVTGAGTPDAIRKQVKIVPRQFLRVLEMHLMSKLPYSVRPTIEVKSKPAASRTDEHVYRLWQLFVKNRLYRQHRDVLAELEVDVRIDKLEKTLQNVELEYARLLSIQEKRTLRADGAPDSNGKRKLDGNAATDERNPGKRARVEDAMQE